MKIREFAYEKDNVTYKVIISYKRQKNIYYRYKNSAFYITAPYSASQKIIFQGLDKYFDKLLKQHQKEVSHFNFEEDYVYLLGEKHSIKELGIIDEDQLKIYLKNLAFDVINERVRKYEQIMDISLPYKVKVKETVRQYGSNSKRTHTLSFQISLVHYAIDIIDTVVVHELAHEYVRNHQKEFYDVVYKYSPNYKFFQKKLKKGIHQ